LILRVLRIVFKDVTLVRQEGLEPLSVGSGGQRRPLYQLLFL